MRHYLAKPESLAQAEHIIFVLNEIDIELPEYSTSKRTRFIYLKTFDNEDYSCLIENSSILYVNHLSEQQIPNELLKKEWR